MSFLDAVLSEARLRILIMLTDDTADGSAHVGLIDQALDAQGTPLSRAQVEATLQWLADQNLLDLSKVASITRATIKQHGKDVARGQARVPGVLRRSDLS